MTSTFRPTAACWSASVAEVNGDQFLRVWELVKVAAGDITPRSEHGFGQLGAGELRLLARRPLSVRQQLLHRRVEHLPLRGCNRRGWRQVSNTDSDFFRPFPLVDGRLLVLTYTSTGFVPAVIDPAPVKDASAIRFLGTAVTEKHPVVTTWQVDPPSAVNNKQLVLRRGPYDPFAHLALDNAFPVLQGYKDSVGVRLPASTSPIRSVSRRCGITAAYTPDSDLLDEERTHVEIEGRYLEWSGSLSWNRRGLLRPVRPDQDGRRGNAFTLGYSRHLVYDPPKTLRPACGVPTTTTWSGCPDYQNVGRELRPLLHARAGWTTGGYAPRWVRWTTTGGQVELAANGTFVSGRVYPQARGDFDVGFLTPIEQFLAVAAHGRRLCARRPRRSVRQLLLRRLRQQLRRQPRDPALPRLGRLPRSRPQRDRRPAFIRALLDWNLPSYAVRRSARRPSTCPWLRPACSAPRWGPHRSCSLRPATSTVGAQPDVHG